MQKEINNKMITKNDCILLLSDINEKGVDTSQFLTKLLKEKEPSLEVIKFINSNRPLDVTQFYEKIRRSYNNKKSVLYKNIVKETEEPQSVLTTLASLQLQLLLFAKNVQDKPMFFNHSRADDITKVIHNYYKTFDIIPCIKLLKIIKCDLVALEIINGRRKI